MYKKKIDKGKNDMLIHEFLQQCEDPEAKRKTYDEPGTMSFSCGFVAKEEGYQSKEAMLHEVMRDRNTLPPTYEFIPQRDR